MITSTKAQASDLTPAAVWLRVSTDGQDSDNQVPDIARFMTHHGLDVAATFQVSDSAWKDGEGGPEYKRAIERVLADAHAGKFKVLVVWALDRITRLGAEDALRLIRKLRERGVTLVSVQEPWLSSSPEIVDVLVAFAGWQAQQESKRKSERIKAGIAKRRAAGGHVGRQAGAKDARARRRSGYVAAWEPGGARRAAS
jgi:DNA invertase Pin-like site-specific DNA recombinase